MMQHDDQAHLNGFGLRRGGGGGVPLRSTSTSETRRQRGRPDDVTAALLIPAGGRGPGRDHRDCW